MRKIMIVLMCIGILIPWQIFQSDLAIAGNKGNKCSIAGVWEYTAIDADDESIGIYTPLEPAGKKFAATAEPLTYMDPTFGDDFFPADTKAGKVVGYAERTSPGTYDNSWYRYGISASAGGPVWKMVSRGKTKMVDCNHRSEAFVVTFYIPLEVEGEIEWVPIECISISGIAERITLAPACGELPSLPDF